MGALSGCVDERFPEPGAEDVIEEAVASFGVPLVTGLPVGHLETNRTWPVGARAMIDGDRGEVRVLERGVQSPT